MKSSVECIPCFVRQTLEAAKFVSKYSSVHEGVLREMLRCLAGIDFDQPPPVVGQCIHRKLRALIGNSDPYRGAKILHNQLALALLPELKELVRKSKDPLYTSVLLAIAGNVLDLGAHFNFTGHDMRSNIAEALSKPFHADIEALRQEIQRASSILYIADNAGEIVFDRLLIEEMQGKAVTVAVRGYPIINDALAEDAQVAGIHEIARVIGNGSDAPGIVLSDCNVEFQMYFNNADVIIAKGQGNYETLSEEDKGNIFFLFKIKCDPVAFQTGFKKGTNVLMPNKKRAKNSCHDQNDDRR